MICSNCQNPIPEGAAFCSHCGARAVQPQPVVDPYFQQLQNQKTVQRQCEMDEVSRLIEYYAPRQGEYDAYDETCSKILHYARGAKSALLIWGCIAASVCLFFLAVGLGEGAPVEEILPFVWLLGIPGILMIVGGIFMKVNNRMQMNRYLGDYAKLSYNLFRHCMSCPSTTIGPEFTNPRVLYVLLRTLRSGRCDTVKEALNLSGANFPALQQYCQKLSQETRNVDATTGVGTIFAAAKFFR